MNLERWEHLLSRAAARGELTTKLSLEEIVSWLTLAQTLLLIKVDAAPIPDAELRRFIRHFIVRPLQPD